MTDLRTAVAARFRELNGDHPMTTADDAYVTEYFASLDELCADRAETPDDLRTHILAGRLPMPSYLRSDGAEMVHPDYLAPYDRLGVDGLPAYYGDEWDGYVGGRYVCLWSVTPDTIRRKDDLVIAIEAALGAPRPEDVAWVAALHGLVDELDVLEPPFTAYDRLRFAGSVSRDRCIDAVRAAYPRASLAA